MINILKRIGLFLAGLSILSVGFAALGFGFELMHSISKYGPWASMALIPVITLVVMIIILTGFFGMVSALEENDER